MKKIIAVLVIFVCVGTALSAQISMSAGGGVLLDMSFRNGMKAKDGDDSMYMGYRNISFGGFGFFDATYAEADVSFAYGSLTQVMKAKLNGESENESESAGSVIQLGISLLGKYPIELGPVTVFPLAGIGYNIVLSAKDKDGEKMYDSEDDDKTAMKQMSQFAILFGGGADYNINDNLYIRGSLLLQVRLAAKEMKDTVKAMNDIDFAPVDFKTTLGFGPVLKVAVGYRF